MTRALAALLLVAGIARAQVPEPLAAVIANVPACDPARATCIGLRLHVPVTDAGPIAKPAWVERQLASANQHFAALDVGFQLVGVEALPASVERVEDAAERHALGRRIRGRVVDVFVTAQLDDVDGKGDTVYGVTWPAAGRKFVILSTLAWERTLAHELGHVFGLPHSTYAVSIMNKTPREEPPVEERTFHADELAKMQRRLRTLVRGRVLENLASSR